MKEPSDVLTNWLSNGLVHLTDVLTNWLSNGLVHLTVTVLLCYILSRFMSKLGSSLILGDVLPAPMIDLTWDLGPHDLTWNLSTNLAGECWLGDELLVSLTDMHSSCWLIDITFKPGTDLTE